MAFLSIWFQIPLVRDDHDREAQKTGASPRRLRRLKVAWWPNSDLPDGVQGICDGVMKWGPAGDESLSPGFVGLAAR